jgi:hypothetical protein
VKDEKKEAELEVTALAEESANGPDIQIVQIFPHGLGTQRIVLRVFTDKPRTIKFRLFRYRKDSPDIVSAVAAIERGEEDLEWPPCTLSQPSRGKLSGDSKLVTGVEIGVAEIDSIFEVSWHAMDDLVADRDRLGLAGTESVQVLPWIGEETCDAPNT